MTYFQKHSRALEVSQDNGRHSVGNSYMRNFKKSIQVPKGNSKCQESNVSHVHRMRKENQSSFQNIKIHCKTPSDTHPPRQSNKQHPSQLQPQLSHPINPTSHHQASIQNLMLETDNSMEEMLNSSINQFERYMEQNSQTDGQKQMLVEQNMRLREGVQRLKGIIRQKLENALKKQKDELTKMLQDYISLITKLLSDKQELTTTIENLQNQLSNARNIVSSLQARLEKERQQKQSHIDKTKLQVEEFLMIINQFEEEANDENVQMQEMKKHIAELQEMLKRKAVGCFSDDQAVNSKLHAQTTKIQTLLELLQASQSENTRLKQALSTTSPRSFTQIEARYQQQLTQLQEQHQQEFIEYERAIKETIAKKNECIERLSFIVEGYRGKKKVFEQSDEKERQKCTQ